MESLNMIASKTVGHRRVLYVGGNNCVSTSLYDIRDVVQMSPRELERGLNI